MLSYQHGFHAGNFADVHKHLVFSLVLDYLVKKPSPITVLDVFAGSGLYRLDSAQARKTGEAEQGIQPLWLSRPWPACAEPYQQAVAEANAGGGLRCYPGSPVLARHWLREGDRHVLCELHPQEIVALRAHLKDGPLAEIHQRDALEALTALTPPPVRRGCALVDPSYEKCDEYRQVAASVRAARLRWPEATWLVWYPLLPGSPHAPLLKMLASAGKRGRLRSEVLVREPGAGMHG